jgi:hypothetical protein
VAFRMQNTVSQLVQPATQGVVVVVAWASV